MDDAELARVRRIVHGLTCRDKLSAELASHALEAFGIDRSAAEIRRDLDAASCEHCAGQAAQPEPRPDPEPVRPVHHQAHSSGFLTGMIERG